MTINVTAPSQILATSSTNPVSINLLNRFDDPFTSGLVAEFTLKDKSLAGGVTEVVLFDQEGDGAPLSVANFLDYVDANAYRNTIIHRSIPGFVVQGGGFAPTDLDDAAPIDENDPVENEFSSNRSNTRGTLAMAKLGGDPDSATNQWFFNLEDNSSNLDNQNGGFTVFGEVIGQDDLDVIDAIAALPTVSIPTNATFSNLPIISDDPSNPILDDVSDLVQYQNIKVSQQDELEFAITLNSNPSLVDASIRNNNLVLEYGANQSGTATITIEATNLLGETIEEELSITVADAPKGTGGNDELLGSKNDDRLKGGNGDDSIIGLNGSDRLLGEKGKDFLLGGSGNDVMKGGSGKDVLEGEKGNDRLSGGGGNDELFGGAGKDQLNGSNGNDQIDGGRGSDNVKGGRGKDVFVLSTGAGSDTIRDFKNGQDKLQVSGISFSDLSIESQGKNTVISLGNDSLATLNGVRSRTITASDFNFI